MNNLNSSDKVILTDVDGVLLNWEYAFHTWMASKGYYRAAPKLLENDTIDYDMSGQYILFDHQPTMKQLVKQFNTSAAIGFLPPLRDAMHYVKQLHEKHGYVFHVITSMSTDRHACELRTQNLKKLFGDTVFERFVYLDTGADKDEALAEYKDSGYMWVEDKYENALAGQKAGLNSLLIEHGHNMHVTDVPLVLDWSEIYNEYTY